MAKDNIPSYDTFLNPVIDALNILGGSATIEELNAKVIETTGLSNTQLEVIHDPQKEAKQR